MINIISQLEQNHISIHSSSTIGNHLAEYSLPIKNRRQKIRKTPLEVIF